MSNISNFLGEDVPIWVSGDTYASSNIVRSPTNFMRYVRITAGAGTTDPYSDTTNWRQDSMVIKSIQRGVISSGTATITAVVTSRCELRYLGQSASTSAGFDNCARIALTGPTSITRTSDQGAPSVSWELTEYH